jgi:hypothetical protein
MAKIHTHYENLKVARMAPQEVIRAAYKALSQKYHPDKNPGNEKAARIMAILNSAYGTLADPLRRQEHDEWIAAEEWEIEWLESTGAEESRDKAPGDESLPAPFRAPRYQAALDPKWWFGLSVCLIVGYLVGALVSTPVAPAPEAPMQGTGAPFEQAWEFPAVGPPPLEGLDVKAVMPSVAKPDADRRAVLDLWTVGKPASSKTASPQASSPNPPEVRTLTVSQALQDRPRDCSGAVRSAPNGAPWPLLSGYVGGYPVDNPGDDVHLMVDNARNPLAVFVKVVDLARRRTVRHVLVLERERFVIDKLARGRYEVRYQEVQVGAFDAAKCGEIN